MRPVRLTMQAFGPYAERVTIDFRNAVEAGLFGIYGPTGSGKSTIFSSMTFALFGEPAKTEQDAPSLRSDRAAADLRTEVEFVFDIGERRYVILRRPEQMRPKQRGGGETREAHEAWLFDATGVALEEIVDEKRGKAIAEKKVSHVNAAVTDLLGYGPAQFRQIVLLPQGRFEAFLAAKTRERLDILRDLFDVSLYRSLVSKMKTEAEAAEQQVRQERAFCVQRLAAEGFESTDALATGISEADAKHAEFFQDENRCRAATKAAQTSLEGARQIEQRFQTAETTQHALTNLHARKPEMETLATQVGIAERARTLLDIETRVNEAAQNLADAAETHTIKQNGADTTAKKAKQAAEAHEMENARAGEIDILRRQIETLQRYGETIEKSVVVKIAADQAREKAVSAKKVLGTAQDKVTALAEQRRKQEEILRIARQTEEKRQSLLALLASLDITLKSAEAFEKAQQDVEKSTGEVAHLISNHEVTIKSASEARIAFEAAERQLTEAQALHLAAKLQPGSPCPVCGATDHPTIATGQIEGAGLDKEFRETKAAWEKAQDAERQVENKLSVAQGVLNERQNRVAALERPTHSSDKLRSSLQAAQSNLAKLGPATNISEFEALLEALAERAAEADAGRDGCRDALGEAEMASASAKARLEELLSVIPEALRDSEVLDAAIAENKGALETREAARNTAAKAATETREAALLAQKEFEAAEKGLSDCRERLEKARQTFKARLVEAELTEETFHSIKSAIDSIESDREIVQDYRHKLNSASDEARKAAVEIEGQMRPDLQFYADALQQMGDELNSATERRTRAGARLEQLRKLQIQLADTLRRLDEAEAVSGPLRNLAALFDAKNPQNIDLETFAIGAMFDQVLEAANQRLDPMTANQYRLERESDVGGRGRRGLGIQVFDAHTGKARSTSTLSGGETFIAALALALGLADVVESASGKIRLDTIFIDEGFGSLDTENGSGTLDQVLQVLGSLVSDNRAVGLVSHVPLVQEAIPNGFYIKKDFLSSYVETRGVV